MTPPDITTLLAPLVTLLTPLDGELRFPSLIAQQAPAPAARPRQRIERPRSRHDAPPTQRRRARWSDVLPFTPASFTPPTGD